MQGMQVLFFAWRFFSLASADRSSEIDDDPVGGEQPAVETVAGGRLYVCHPDVKSMRTNRIVQCDGHAYDAT